MTDTTEITRGLVEQARRGDDNARRMLLERCRLYLRRMVAARLDRRLAPRIDPSDVIQETLAAASLKMDNYLRDQPLPFFGWLRQLAAESLRVTHRRHLFSRRRSVERESQAREFFDDSAAELGRMLLARDTSPSNRLLRKERQERVRAALSSLPPRDREILVMRHLEHMSAAEMAEALGITEGAVKVRLLRALNRIRGLIEDLG